MDEPLEARLRFLRAANTERTPHSKRALFDHLVGTRQLLLKWRARAPVCDAGLFHSVYGTEHYTAEAIPMSMRAEGRSLIGDEAEALVWLFCVLRRESLATNLGLSSGQSVEHRSTGEPLPLTARNLPTWSPSASPIRWRRFRACSGTCDATAASTFGRSAMPPTRTPAKPMMNWTRRAGCSGNEEGRAHHAPRFERCHEP